MKDFIVNDEQSLGKMLEKVRSAQEKFAAYTQEQVDKIFFAAAVAANKAAHYSGEARRRGNGYGHRGG